ncbi:hypothetical protein PIB30_025106 [Stylosanthes scabra]|uniref:BHLH domain-containing protein n=1 Tax=Stylosanthes scabra TaxID=79078 RepID=A0ABU6VC64_9FABA|nr:hypothetical protein [Stylosanthes scabra]
MESPNLHHQHQHPPPPSSSSSSSSYGSTTHHSWPPNNNITFSHIQEDINNNLRWRGGTLRDHYHHVGVPLIQDHHLCSSDDNSAQQSCLTLNTTNNHMLNSHTHTHTPPSTQQDKLLLKTFLSAQDLIDSNNITTTTFCGSSRRNFSHIYPTINISNNMNNHSPSSSPNNNMMMMMTSHSSLDLPAFMTTASHHQQVDLGLATFSDNLSFSPPPPCSNSTTTTNKDPSQYFSNGTTTIVDTTKRPCTSIIDDTKPSQSLTASKKSRSESRPSCPPFKVRKEKLGDRIAALQQLVAPFGKTDTASVLMEAIGYIKFLQSQVETLSVPYMKPSQNQTKTRIMQGA